MASKSQIPPALLWQTLETLNPKDPTPKLVLLHAFGFYGTVRTHTEIAETLNISAKKVEEIKTRSLSELRAKLEAVPVEVCKTFTRFENASLRNARVQLAGV